MARKSLEYWATPTASRYEDELDAIEAQGYNDAMKGLKPQVAGKIFGLKRTMYFKGYNAAKVA